MASTSVLYDTTPKKSEIRGATPPGISLWAGVLWIVGIAAAWNVVLVLFHNLMARLLS